MAYDMKEVVGGWCFMCLESFNKARADPICVEVKARAPFSSDGAPKGVKGNIEEPLREDCSRLQPESS